MISSTPDAAYEICTEYCPPCDQPFKYVQPKLNLPEVIRTKNNNNNDKQNLTNNNNSNNGKKDGKQQGKKKKKHFQALESQYTSLDGNLIRINEDFDEDDYEEGNDDDEDENQTKENLSFVVPDINIISVTRQPSYDNNVSEKIY